jgi:hypothetical protein
MLGSCGYGQRLSPSYCHENGLVDKIDDQNALTGLDEKMRL